MVLPAGAVIRVRLVLPGPPGGVSATLSEQIRSSRGEPLPVEFAVPYDPAKAGGDPDTGEPPLLVFLEASVEFAGAPILISAAPVAVSLRDAGTPVDLPLRRPGL